MYARTVLIVAAVAALSGCSAARYKAQADKEVGEIIRLKQKAALGQETPFSIEGNRVDPIFGQPLKDQEPLGDVKLQPAVMLSLTQALDIATRNSSDYQDSKEGVFTTALGLTYARYRWGPVLTGSASAAYTKTQGDETVGGGPSFGLSGLFADGTEFTANLSTTLLTHLVSSPREAAWSVITADLTKHLWGGKKREAQENILQAERNMVYKIREFAQYHRSFAVTIASSYYGTLQQRDIVLNSWNNYQILIQAHDRTKMMGEAGRLPKFQVDQAEQDELRAKDTYVRSVQSYQLSVDRFKKEIGIPVDAPIALDPAELAAVRNRGIDHPDIDPDLAVDVALAARLDLANAYEQVADADRRIALAEEGLQPAVDLVLSSSVPTEATRPGAFRTALGTYSGGLNVDLPLDRRAQRNAYRQALIDLERSKRSAALFEDQVKLDVRDSWRKLEEAKTSYDIQQMSLTLARSRVENTSLLLQAGRADTRELLDSQDALLQAQNALIRALIDHLIARLNFWQNVGILDVNENGLWQENYDRFFPQGGNR